MMSVDTPVREAVWAALDFESTGAAPGCTDEPVQVGIAVLRGSTAEPGCFFRSYLRCSSSANAAASAVHGIGVRKTEGAPPLSLLWPEFKLRLHGSVVVAHGAGTEKRFLRAFPMHGFGPWVDTLSVSRAVLPDLPDHALGCVVGALGLEGEVKRLCPQFDWHDALFDAVACLVIVRHLIGVLELGDMSVGQLANLDASGYRRRRVMVRHAKAAGLHGPESSGRSEG